jgi:hypothetical protein
VTPTCSQAANWHSQRGITPSHCHIWLKFINQFVPIPNNINGLYFCLNFRQMLQTLMGTGTRVRSSQVFNKVIHSFRGYSKFICKLNQLTKV